MPLGVWLVNVSRSCKYVVPLWTEVEGPLGYYGGYQTFLTFMSRMVGSTKTSQSACFLLTAIFEHLGHRVIDTLDGTVSDRVVGLGLVLLMHSWNVIEDGAYGTLRHHT